MKYKCERCGNAVEPCILDVGTTPTAEPIRCPLDITDSDSGADWEEVKDE